MFLNVKKIKIMSIDRCIEKAVINIDREEMEGIGSFEYYNSEYNYFSDNITSTRAFN